MKAKFFMDVFGDILTAICWVIFGLLLESGKADGLSFFCAFLVAFLTITRRA